MNVQNQSRHGGTCDWDIIIFISVIFFIVRHNQSLISRKYIVVVYVLVFLSVSVFLLLTIKLSYIFANIFCVYLVLQEGSVR